MAGTDPHQLFKLEAVCHFRSLNLNALTLAKIWTVLDRTFSMDYTHHSAVAQVADLGIWALVIPQMRRRGRMAQP